MAHRPPVRVLFLAWGYSIHAERRIRLFAEDPGFAVSVVSPHHYEIPGVRTFLLTDERTRTAIAEELASRCEAERRKRGNGSLGDSLSARAGKLGTYLTVGRLMHRIGIRKFALLRNAVNSFEILLEIETGRRDLAILSSAVAAFRPDVVFLQTLLYPCYLAFYLTDRIPIVITFWNGDLKWWAQWNGIERLVKRQIVAHGVRRADAITVNSRQAYDASLALGARLDKISLIRYPGVDLARFRRVGRDEAKRALGVGSRRVVLCPRGLGGYLNSDVIVEAAAGVVRKYPDTLFLFVSGVGGAAEIAKHQEQARALGIEDHMRWEGHVPWEAMPAYYNASDAMVSVSSNDSLPNCMLEAMACGVPVVMGDIPAIREWIADGVNGLLVPPRDPRALADGIVRVFADGDGTAATFRERNLDLIGREADGQRNAAQVKELVRAVAREAGRR